MPWHFFSMSSSSGGAKLEPVARFGEMLNTFRFAPLLNDVRMHITNAQNIVYAVSSYPYQTHIISRVSDSAMLFVRVLAHLLLLFMPNPKLGIEEKLGKWAQEHKWLVSKREHDVLLYRCSICALNPAAGRWSTWRDAERLQKSTVVTHLNDNNHKDSIKLAATRDTNNAYWRNQASRVDQEEDQKLMSDTPLVQCALWLAREEVSIQKFESLADHCKAVGAPVSTEFHSSRYSSWEFTEAIDIVVMRKNAETIRASAMHSGILDTTNDRDEW